MIEKFIQCDVINACTKLMMDRFAQAKEVIKKTKNIYLSLLTNILIPTSERPLLLDEERKIVRFCDAPRMAIR